MAEVLRDKLFIDGRSYILKNTPGQQKLTILIRLDSIYLAKDTQIKIVTETLKK